MTRHAVNPSRAAPTLTFGCFLLSLSLLSAPASAIHVRIEVDWLVANDHDHKPTPCEMAAMQWAFERAGHTIDIEMGNAITETAALEVIDFVSGGFDSGEWATLESTHRAHPPGSGWHYAVFAHNYSSGGVVTSSSGLGEVFGDESIVSLGSFVGEVGTPFGRASTLMHELGHNLGLQHSGDQNEAVVGPLKPNYASVMSYRYQLWGLKSRMVCEGIAPPGVALFDLDFSHGLLPTLDESSLDEATGLGFGQGIDWDCSGSTGGSVPVDVSNVLNRCSGGTELSVIRDHDDWSDLVNASFALSAQPPATISCITAEENDLARLAGGTGCEPDPNPDVCGEPIGCERNIPLNQTQWGFFSQQCPSQNRLTSYGRSHHFTLLSNTAITIDLESSGTDTFLYLIHRPTGNIIGTDDDGGTGTNSRITGNLGAGSYTIDATTFWDADDGDYRLTVQGQFFPTLTLSTSGSGSGRVNWTSNPSLPPPGLNCPHDCFGTFAVGNEVTLVPEPNPGSTFVGWTGDVCTGFGTCVFNIQTVEQVTARFGANCENDIQVGDNVSASLVADCPSFHRPGSFARFYTFDLAQASAVVVDMGSSGGLDPYLFLLAGGTTGAVLAQDDDSGPGKRARIEAILAAGTYTIEATAFDGSIGSFLLGLQAVPADPATVFADGFESGDDARWSDATSRPRPVHRWSFTTDGEDSIGNADAQLLGGATVSSKRVELDGQASFVSLPIAGTLASLTSVTIETWVRVDALDTWARIFDFGTGETVNWFATPEAFTGNLRSAITTGGAAGEQRLDGNSPLITGVLFVHFAVSLDATTQTAVMYVDGSAVDTQTWTLTPAALGPLTQLWLGRSQYTDPYLDGAFDEVRIWNRALTAGEIAANRLLGPDDL